MNDTLTLIDNINRSLRWLKSQRPEEYDTKSLELIALRRQLRKIANAEREKPAVAAFGESQKGKSYLMGNLLQKQKAPFKVKDEKGEWIDFVARVNPIGDNKEATGVVTRFTSFDEKRNPGRYIKEHPVIVKLFKVSEIATILCDSFYHDLTDTPIYADDDIRAISEEIYERYRNQPEVSQTIISEDDILDIKAYLDKFVKKAQGLTRSGYFERLSLVIRRVPSSEWASVLQYLWHGNPYLTVLFKRLVDALRRLSFSKEVYVDFDAVMHLGDNKNTIMSVACLNGLDDKAWDRTTTVYVRKDGNLTPIPQYPKCELCAICAEVMVRIEPEFMDDVDSYFYDAGRSAEAGFMTADTRAKLPQEVKKEILGDIDLLDFPGARNRLSVKEEFLSKTDANGMSNLVQMLLRGKVAFLFNNYSEARIINILLYCHDSANNSVNDMYIMIDDWVKNYVGATADERRKTVERCGNVSPLFVIGTKFNMDMVEGSSEDSVSENGLNQRWEGRFITVLYTQSFKAESVDWFKNWDATGSTFRNTYLLRDYKYSGCDGKGNNLFNGYDEKAEHPAEQSLHLSAGFYNRMRDTFVTSPHIKMYFADPAKAWDVAATVNNDGALYIIQNLSVVAKHMFANRSEQFAAILRKVRDKLMDIMRDYYVSDDTSEILADNLRKAYSIFRELEFTCQNNPEYFGHLINGLQMQEDRAFHKLHDLMPSLAGKVNDNVEFKSYEMLRERCRNFAGCNTDEEKWQMFIRQFFFRDKEEAREYLDKRNIDPAKLFAGPEIKRRNSAVITRDLMDFWTTSISSIEFVNMYSGDNMMDPGALNNMVKCLIDTTVSVGLPDTIERHISDYVDIQNINNINQNLVSDVIATTISDFVTDFGNSYLTDEQMESARKVSAEYCLPCFDWIDRDRKEEYDDDELTQLFDRILRIEGCYTEAYKANYNAWIENMFIAFIAHLNIPEYDREANNELKSILDGIRQ